MMIRLVKNDRGVALLVTLGILTVLTVAALELNRRSRAAIVDAALLRDQITLLHMAAAGVEGARALWGDDEPTVRQQQSRLDSIRRAREASFGR